MKKLLGILALSLLWCNVGIALPKCMNCPPMIFTGNPLIIKPGMVFFMHMILMDSKAQLAMNLGETYLITETGNERLGKVKLDLVVL